MSPPAVGGAFFVCSLFIFLLMRSAHKNESIILKSTAVVLDIQESKAQDQPLIYFLNGLSEASVSLVLKTELSGHVESILVKSGDKVKKGDIIVKMGDPDIKARLEAAKARVNEKELEYKAKLQLSEKGVRTVIDAERAKADFEAAKAELAKMEESDIKAPEDGIIDHIMVSAGDFLQMGASIGKFLKLKPLKIICYVSEKNRVFLSEGDKTELNYPLLNKKNMGKISFIAKSSDLKTKVYRVEVDVENEDESIVEGMSCNVSIFTTSKMRHKIPLSSIGLNEDGKPGIKIVSDESQILFLPISIEQIHDGHIILTHDKDSLKYVKSGGDFVIEGQKVNIATGELLL